MSKQQLPEEPSAEEALAETNDVSDKPKKGEAWFYNQDPMFHPNLVHSTRFFIAPVEGPYVQGTAEVSSAVPVSGPDDYPAHILALQERLDG